MTLSYVSGRWVGDDQVVQAVQGYWAQVGVKMKIKKVDNAGLVADLALDPDQNPGVRRHAATVEFLPRLPSLPDVSTEATHANAAQRSGYSNPEVDTLSSRKNRTSIRRIASRLSNRRRSSSGTISPSSTSSSDEFLGPTKESLGLHRATDGGFHPPAIAEGMIRGPCEGWSPR